MKTGREKREGAVIFTHPFFLYNVCAPRLSTVYSALTVLGSLSLVKFISLDVDKDEVYGSSERSKVNLKSD